MVSLEQLFEQLVQIAFYSSLQSFRDILRAFVSYEPIPFQSPHQWTKVPAYQPVIGKDILNSLPVIMFRFI